PLLINDVVLGGFFPGETHALTDDWCYFMKNLLLFWAGYLLISRRTFWQLVADQRRYSLVATLICTALLYGTRAVVDEDVIEQSALFRTLYSFNGLGLTWFSVLMTIGYGYTYLNRTHPWLPHLNAAVYPFYILHQTVIVLIGYYVLTRTSLGIYSGFLTVSFASLIVCVVTYLVLIRPFWLPRLLFGVK
ncbi:MAG TPA: acyltransferase, partial [Fibrella sp.]